MHPYVAIRCAIESRADFLVDTKFMSAGLHALPCTCAESHVPDTVAALRPLRRYEESQAKRMRLIELSRYMHWRVIPRDLRFAIRSYLSFVWDCNEKVGETEAEVTEVDGGGS